MTLYKRLEDGSFVGATPNEVREAAGVIPADHADLADLPTCEACPTNEACPRWKRCDYECWQDVVDSETF